MKTKVFTVILILLITTSGLIYFVKINGWMSFQKRSNTPSEFISRVNIGRYRYNLDKRTLLNEFEILLEKQDDFFKNTSFSISTTKIIIDTIVYSPDFKNLAVTIIAKNPTSKQLSPDKNHKWFYNSTCYLGIKRGLRIELKMIGPTFTNEYTLESASKDIRDVCFKHFIVKGSKLYTYNLNDKRFWRSKIWTYYFQ